MIRRPKLHAQIAILWLLPWIAAQAADDGDVAVFRVTEVNGYISVNSRQDEQIIHLTGDTSTVEKRTAIEEDVYVNTQGYIYHPKFLSFEFGVGPHFIQNNLTSTSGNYQQNETMYNMNARLDFLQEKSFPFSLFYNKENPTLSLNLTDQFEQENIRYGANFQFLRPLLPVNLVIDTSRQQMSGEGFDLRINDQIDQTTIRTYLPLEQDGYRQLVYGTTAITSNSGFLDLPITTSNITTDNVTYDSKLFWGEAKQLTLNNLFSYTDQKGLRPFQEMRFNPNLRWKHSDSMDSFYRLNYSSNEQIDLRSANTNLTSGIRKAWQEDFYLNSELSINQQDTTGLSMATYGLDTAINYSHTFDNGKFNINGGVRFDATDRSVTSLVPVRDRLINLTGTLPYTLPDDHIVLSSITASTAIGNISLPIVLGSEGQTCPTLAAGDPAYLFVTPFDVQTRVAYCDYDGPASVGVNISYDYDPGGTVGYNNQVNYLQVSLDLLRKYSLYAQYRSNTPTIVSGDPLLPLNDSVDTRFGAKASIPLINEQSIGAELINENHAASQIPYIRNSFDSFYQLPIWNGVFRLNAQMILTDYFNSSEDVDLNRTSLQFRARPSHRTTLSLEYSDEIDTGGSIVRQTRIGVLALNWRVRKLSANAELRTMRERVGDNTQDRSLLRLNVKREL